MAAQALHLTGTVVIDDHHEVGEAWVLGGHLTFTRPLSDVEVMSLSGVFLPGLVDVHCHVGLGAQGAISRDIARGQAIRDRESGVLLIRDAGSPSDTRWIDQDPELPQVIRCGHHLARPKRYLRNYGEELGKPEDLARAIVENLGRADGWNKIVADWIDREVGDLTPLWSPEQLKAAMSAAHERGARVTAHTFAHEAIDPLLAAGLDCIEHGTGMDESQMRRAAAAGVPVTPTLLQIGQFENIAAQGETKFPVYAARMRGMYARRYDQARAFFDSGMRLLIGTDAGGTIAHGRIADECAELVSAGIPAREVVAFASWRTRAYLGVQGMEEGAPADVVGYERDPREDIGALKEPAHVIVRGTRM